MEQEDLLVFYFFAADKCTAMSWKRTVQKLARKLGDHLSADSH